MSLVHFGEIYSTTMQKSTYAHGNYVQPIKTDSIYNAERTGASFHFANGVEDENGFLPL